MRLTRGALVPDRRDQVSTDVEVQLLPSCSPGCWGTSDQFARHQEHSVSPRHQDLGSKLRGYWFYTKEVSNPGLDGMG